MQSQKPNWVQYSCAFLVLVVLVGLLGGWYAPSVNTEKVVVESVECDFTGLSEKIDGIQNTIDEDDLWTNEAEDLAIEEWSKSDYKYLYRFLQDIDEKEDIEKVVIKDSEVTSFDTEDRDATVVQELKVYYENLDGDDVKEYVTVTSIIEDGDVEDFEFE